jgi:O-antigen/teichoic acid export membrane protein
VTAVLRRNAGRARHLLRIPGRRHLLAFVSLTGASQGQAVLSFLSVAVLVRLTDAKMAGQIFFAQALASLWFMVMDPRLDDAAQRFVPAQQLGGAGRGSALFLRLLRLDVLIGVAGAALGVALAAVAWRLGWLPADQAPLVLIALLSSGAAAANGTASVAYAIAGRLGQLGVIRLAAAAAATTAALVGLVAGGPVAYLVVAGLAGAATTGAMAVLATRTVREVLGPPARGPVPLPAGFLPFTAKSSVATSLAFGADAGVLTLAGFLGGPAVVTMIKLAGSPGRLFVSAMSPVASQLYPRIAAAAVTGDGVAIRRDVLRATWPLAALGAVAIAVAVPVAGPVLALVYGPEFTALAAVAVIMLGASCLRATVVWSKVLPLAVGRPGLRLAFVAGEGVLTLGALALATQVAGQAEDAALVFAVGTALVAAAVGAAWLALLRPLAARVRPAAAERPEPNRAEATT